MLFTRLPDRDPNLSAVIKSIIEELYRFFCRAGLGEPNVNLCESPLLVLRHLRISDKTPSSPPARVDQSGPISLILSLTTIPF